MRNFCTLLMVVFLSLGLVTTSSYAKRFGGGKSFGVQRSAQSYNYSKPSSSYNSARPNFMGRWGGLLGGLLIGGLLGSLLLNNGVASGLLSWLMIGIVLLIVMNLLRKRRQYNYQSNTAAEFAPGPANFNSQPFNSHYDNAVDSPNFNLDNFLREAKSLFIRLQAAWDAKNMNDIRQFTSPEVFAEISLQLQEETENNITEVINVNADLLEPPSSQNAQTATVRFTGTLRENGINNSLNEVWYFRQADTNGQWLVSGLQQG